MFVTLEVSSQARWDRQFLLLPDPAWQLLSPQACLDSHGLWSSAGACVGNSPLEILIWKIWCGLQVGCRGIKAHTGDSYVERCRGCYGWWVSQSALSWTRCSWRMGRVLSTLEAGLPLWQAESLHPLPLGPLVSSLCHSCSGHYPWTALPNPLSAPCLLLTQFLPCGWVTCAAAGPFHECICFQFWLNNQVP